MGSSVPYCYSPGDHPRPPQVCLQAAAGGWGLQTTTRVPHQPVGVACSFTLSLAPGNIWVPDIPMALTPRPNFVHLSCICRENRWA